LRRAASSFSRISRATRFSPQSIPSSFLNRYPSNPNLTRKPHRIDSNNTKPSIVLVHGAFADASGWQKIILGLEEKDFSVTAVQIPLKSLAD
jgi:hypothetical protein